MKGPALVVHTQTPIKALGDLSGIFFEDLNHAADGGLYGEMVQNCSFEFDPVDNPAYHPLTAWETVERGGSRVRVHVEDRRPLHRNNPHYLVLEVLCLGTDSGIRNLGYNTGMRFQKGSLCRFSCFARLLSGCRGNITERLEDREGNSLGETTIRVEDGEWGYVEGEILSLGETCQGCLAVYAAEKLHIALDMVSLFPKDTYKGRSNGMRRDIAELLEGMRPRFMRFPGDGGTLIMDATCYLADIAYPQDLNLLNEAREKLEGIIDEICQEQGLPKLRVYRKKARKDYLKLAKSKKRTAKQLRKVIGAQLRYIRRDRGYVVKFIQTGMVFKSMLLTAICSVKPSVRFSIDRCVWRNN